MSALTVTVVPAALIEPWVELWRALEARTGEANPFYAPGWAMAAIQHLREGHGLVFLLVLDRAAPRDRQLLALLPLRQSRPDAERQTSASWHHPFFALGTPLLDAERAEEALHAALGFLSLGQSAGSTLLLSEVAADGPAAQALQRAATGLSLPVAQLNQSARAALVLAQHATSPPSAASNKRRKELGRVQRRLAEKGELAFILSRTYDEFRAGLEAFLQLEAEGWKAARGTALIQDAGSAAFARAALWPMAKTGSARIARLVLAGRSIAAGVILSAGSEHFFWKIAYDEAFSAYSPGVLLADDIGKALADEKHLGLIDSCAMPGNRMIESLWPGRRNLCDLAIGLVAGDQEGFKRALARQSTKARLRDDVKHLYRRLRGMTK